MPSPEQSRRALLGVMRDAQAEKPAMPHLPDHASVATARLVDRWGRLSEPASWIFYSAAGAEAAAASNLAIEQNGSDAIPAHLVTMTRGVSEVPLPVRFEAVADGAGESTLVRICVNLDARLGGPRAWSGYHSVETNMLVVMACHQT